jgi:hypothetical protein
VRVSSVSRSENWIWACWMNTASSETFVAYGTVEEQGSGSAPDSEDNDGDGMADAWEIGFFGGTNEPGGGAAEDWDGDGFLNHHEYVTGSSPTNGQSGFQFDIKVVDGKVLIEFTAVEATGMGYEGLARFYNLDETADIRGSWGPVPDYTEIPGTVNDVVTHTNAVGPGGYYRVRIRLE